MSYHQNVPHVNILQSDAKDLEACQGQARQARTTIEYMSRMNIYSEARDVRATAIVCTIGPVSRSVEFLLQMMENGMNVARMNFSHGSHEYHGETVANCRKAAKLYEEKHGIRPSLAIALDTRGPEIRTGLLEGDDGRKEVALVADEAIQVTSDGKYKEKCTSKMIWVDYANICNVVKPGKRIFIDDGLISIVVKSIDGNVINGVVENGGLLGSRKGCNLPGTDTDLPAVSAKDIADLKFGVEQNVDMIFASFIRDGAGVQSIRNILKEQGADHIKIISKIENQQGVTNIDEVIRESDGIMVARGDMGIEIPTEKVFIAQKQIIAKCNVAGKPVICATQMLESMVKKPRPTRAEGSDVANAVLDGADCVMLSGETAKGDYPLECIITMANLCKEAEACLWNRRFFDELCRSEAMATKVLDTTQSTAMASVQAAYNTRAAVIICITTSGATAREASRWRPTCPILAVTRFERVARSLHLHRGCIPLYYEKDRDADWTKDVDDRIQFAVNFGLKHGFIKTGDSVVCITGWRQGAGSSNTIRTMIVN